MKNLMLASLLACAAAVTLAACNKTSETTDNVVQAPAYTVAVNSADEHAGHAPAVADKDAHGECADPNCPDEGGHEAVVLTAKDKAPANAEAGKAQKLPAPPKEISVAGTKKPVPVIAVAALNENPTAFSGLIAIDGTVGELFADKGKFILKDCSGADACCPNCADNQKLAVSFDKKALKGKLPAVDARVLVVAEITATETGGFTLAVRELREGDKTVATFSQASKA